MRVQSWEEGERPTTIATRARSFAPQAKAAVVDMLASQDWAHLAYVVIDWTGTIAYIGPDGRSQDDPALDKGRPVMYIQVVKAMPQLGGTAIVEERLDIDNLFGTEFVTRDDLVSVVLALKEALDEKVEAVRQGGRN